MRNKDGVIVLKPAQRSIKREAAEMLHNISLYPRSDRRTAFADSSPKKEATASTLLSHMLERGRIFCAGN